MTLTTIIVIVTIIDNKNDDGSCWLQDTSTGILVAQHHTKMGSCAVMRQNPHNACIALGHANGVVSMWSPNVTAPLVKMLSHKVSLLLYQ